MKKNLLHLFFLSACLLLCTYAHAQTAVSLTAEARAAWTAISTNIVKAAEKMPAENYSFRPTAEVRSFGQLIGHVTDAHYAFCAPLHPEKKAPVEAEKKLSDKAELVAALKESVNYCNAAMAQLTDGQVAEAVKLFGRDRAKLSVAQMNIAHDNEHYGNLVTYLRLKGIVPPSSEPRQSAAQIRLYFDQAHGEAEPPPMAEIATRLNLNIKSEKQPITAEALNGYRLLYLRAPNAEFTASEKTAIVNFVKAGGSLLLVLDEENRQSLAKTGVNDLIAPFEMQLTPDTPYVHNCGALAKAGEINKTDREIPYSGGRAVTGGTPFAYQLDRAGKPAQAFAAYKKLDNGARIIVMGEGMASLFLGKPEGQRLTGVDRDASRTTYWGKDSALFMEEVLAWLIKR